jgi:hypothetical protein
MQWGEGGYCHDLQHQQGALTGLEEDYCLGLEASYASFFDKYAFFQNRRSFSLLLYMFYRDIATRFNNARP